MTAQLELFATPVKVAYLADPAFPYILWDILVLGVWVRAIAHDDHISLAFSDSGEGDQYDGIHNTMTRCDEIPLGTTPEQAAELIATGRSETTWLRGKGPVGKGLVEFMKQWGPA